MLTLSHKTSVWGECVMNEWLPHYIHSKEFVFEEEVFFDCVLWSGHGVFWFENTWMCPWKSYSRVDLWVCLSPERYVCECKFRLLWMYNFVEAVLLYVFMQMCFSQREDTVWVSVCWTQAGLHFFLFFNCSWSRCLLSPFMCVMRSENQLYLMAAHCQAGYFRFTVWVAAVRMSQTDR